MVIRHILCFGICETGGVVLESMALGFLWKHYIALVNVGVIIDRLSIFRDSSCFIALKSLGREFVPLRRLLFLLIDSCRF